MKNLAFVNALKTYVNVPQALVLSSESAPAVDNESALSEQDLREAQSLRDENELYL
jgi:hypothetical protein